MIWATLQFKGQKIVSIYGLQTFKILTRIKCEGKKCTVLHCFKRSYCAV